MCIRDRGEDEEAQMAIVEERSGGMEGWADGVSDCRRRHAAVEPDGLDAQSLTDGDGDVPDKEFVDRLA